MLATRTEKNHVIPTVNYSETQQLSNSAVVDLGVAISLQINWRLWGVKKGLADY